MTETIAPDTEATQEGLAKEAVISAAIRCFKKFGSNKTSMSDIAREAGLSRKTLYRMFEDRPALVNHVLFKLLQGMGSKAQKALGKYSDFKSAIVEGSIDCIRIGQREKLFQSIVRNETNFQVEHFLVQGNDDIRAAMVKIWYPVFELGRAEGSLRSDLSDRRLAELIQNVHSLAQMRNDKSVNAQRAFLTDLLWAAVSNRCVD